MLNDLENSQTESAHYSSMQHAPKSVTSPFGNAIFKIRPKYYKILMYILETFGENIFNYFTIPELSLARCINKHFLYLINNYFQIRVKYEIQAITSFQNYNQDKSSIFMKNIDNQIPISNNNWLDFDLNSVTKTIQSLSRNTITQLRSIKNTGKLPDSVYAPFCIIFGYTKTNNYKVRSDGWKKTAHKILNNANFFIQASKLDLENFNDNDILEAFVVLNLPELELNKVKRYSPALGKLIKWCQAVVSYHILIHPYTYRNDKGQFEEGGDIYMFAQQMNEMINKFYKFKRFLFNIDIVKIPLGDYVFNLQHSRIIISPNLDYNEILNENIIGNILSYLPIKQSVKFISVNKMFLAGFKESLHKITLEIFKEIFYFKHSSYDQLYKKLPMIYDNNVFSKYFLMLDDILNSECNCNEQGTNFVPFLSKEQLSDIKNLKIENDIVNSITKVLCVLLNVKPERKPNARGEITNLYLQKVKLLAINGSLVKMMRSVNKLDLSKNQIKVLSENMLRFNTNEALDEIKRINRGLYQLLIWELYIFEYLKEFNPFCLVNVDLLVNSNSFTSEELGMIDYYYLQLMEFLKETLKAKYHFYSVNLDTTYKMPNYDFKKLNHQLYEYLQSQNVNIDNLFDSACLEHGKISAVYFQNKDLIHQTAKPALYERIMIEIISNSLETSRDTTNLNTSKGDNSNTNNTENILGTIKEENSLINSNKVHKTNYQNAIIATNNTYGHNNYNTNYDSNLNNYGNLNYNNIGNVNSNNNYYSNPALNNLFDMISNDIIIKNILFFLEINSLPNFSLVNKRCNKCIKTHMFIRLFLLNRQKKQIEDANYETISQIDNKRIEFFNEFEMAPPSKEHACALMDQLTNDDILELKQFFKKHNKTYEKVIAPLVVLFGGKPKTGYNIDGSRSINYFIPAQKIIYKRDFARKLHGLELETIPLHRFNQVEKLMQDPVYNEDKIRSLSPCLYHLMYWLMGVVEFHRVFRKYSLSYYDYELLEKEEIEFCVEMDNLLLLYYKLMRYVNKYCKKYEKTANEMIKSIDLQFVETENEEDEGEEEQQEDEQ